MSKATHADMRHRVIFHNSMGPYVMEKIFGSLLINSDGVEVSVRDVAETHILEDLGRIPSVSDWVKYMSLEEWMGGHLNRSRRMKLGYNRRVKHADWK